MKEKNIRNLEKRISNIETTIVVSFILAFGFILGILYSDFLSIEKAWSVLL